MNARVQPLVAFLMAVVAVPLVAQQGNPPTGEPATPDQTASAAVAASPASELAAPLQVEGTIVTLTADHLELKVEKAAVPPSQSESGLEGRTVPFLIDATTEKPAQFKTGDRADLWFTQDGDQRRAVRVALVAATDASSNGAPEAQAPSVPADTAVPAALKPADQPAKHEAAVAKPKATALTSALPQPVRSTVLPNAGADVMKTPPAVGATEPNIASPGPEGSVDVVDSLGASPASARPQTAARPEPAAPLPFVALGGLAALAALVMLRFTLRTSHVELRIGTGKGGLER